jgi:hypothetical protein
MLVKLIKIQKLSIIHPKKVRNKNQLHLISKYLRMMFLHSKSIWLTTEEPNFLNQILKYLQELKDPNLKKLSILIQIAQQTFLLTSRKTVTNVQMKKEKNIKDFIKKAKISLKK